MFHAQRPRLVTAAEVSPISLDEAKAHLRVEHAEDDGLIAALIAAAVGHLDGWAGVLGRCLVHQVWAQSFSAFPCEPCLDLPFVDASNVAVTYRAPGTAEDVALASTAWHVARAPGGDHVVLAQGMVWPVTACRPDAVTVTATYGYGAAASDVPQPLKAAMLLIVGDLYRNRETGVIGTVSQAITMSVTVDALIAPHRCRYGA